MDRTEYHSVASRCITEQLLGVGLVCTLQMHEYLMQSNKCVRAPPLMEGQQYRALNTVVHSKCTTVDFYETAPHTSTHTHTHTHTHTTHTPHTHHTHTTHTPHTHTTHTPHTHHTHTTHTHHTHTHTLTHPQVDIGEQQFLVATMDDGGMVRTSKDVQRPRRVEWFQHDWLRTQDNSLTAAELTCNDGGGWGD